MNDFTKDFAQALFNPDKINDLLRKELQQAVNNLLEAELTAFLGYDPYARNGWNTGNSRNGAYFRKVDTQFGPIEVQVPRDRNGQFHQHTLLVVRQRVLMKQAVTVSWHLDFNFAKLRIHLAKVGTVPRIAGIPAVSCIRIIT